MALRHATDDDETAWTKMTDPDRALLVLRDDVTRDDVDDAAARLGLRLVNVVRADATRPAQLVLVTGDRTTTVHWIVDSRLGVTYVAAAGARAVQTARGLAETLPVVSREALGARAAAGDLHGALPGLALAATPPIDAAEVAAFARAFASEDPKLRGVALVSAAYARWPELEPIVRERARVESDPQLRARAEAIAAQWGVAS